MKPDQTLEDLIAALDAAGVKYMLTGSIAGSYHGVPRSTQDINLVVEGTKDQLLGFARRIAEKEFYVSEEAVREAVATHGQFNVIDRRTAWKVDLILRKEREFSRTEFARRSQEEALGLALWFATAEDVILAKLEWAKDTGSERQISDVVGIIESQGDALDQTYVERWASVLGVEQQWSRAQERARQVNDEK